MKASFSDSCYACHSIILCTPSMSALCVDGVIFSCFKLLIVEFIMSSLSHDLAARRLALAHPHELVVLDHHSFYHPGWEESAAALLFEPLQSRASATAFENSFAIHLFESNKFVVPYVEKLTGMDARGHL